MVEKPHIVILAKGGSFWQGGRQYTLNLLAALMWARGDGNAFDLSVFVNGRDELAHYERLRPHLRICGDTESLQEAYSLANRVRWRIMRSAGWINPRLEEALLRIGATFAYPVRSRRIQSADWIPDFQYRHFPDGSNPEEVEGRKREFAAIARVCRTIALSSVTVEKDCHAELPETIGRTTVLRFRAFGELDWFATDPLQTVKHYHLPERFVLVSNTLAPTKNHLVVLEALARMPAEQRAKVHVVCTGDIYDYRNPGFYNRFLARVHELGLREQISILGQIPKQAQIQLLRATLAYLQPALFEGWNTGVEEARMVGKPILLSDIPVQREQAPPYSTYFDPRNPDDLAGRLDEVFSSPAAIGFDPAVEKLALAAYAELQLDYARDFLCMAVPEPARRERVMAMLVPQPFVIPQLP